MNLKQFLVFENHFMSQQTLIVRHIFIFLLKHRYIESEFFSLFVNEKPPAVQVDVVYPPSLEATCLGIHQPSPTKRVYAALRASHLRGPGVSEMGPAPANTFSYSVELFVLNLKHLWWGFSEVHTYPPYLVKHYFA